MKRKGWRGEPIRHGLASKGISTKLKDSLVDDERFLRSIMSDSSHITDSVLHDMGDHLSLDFKIDMGIDSRNINSSITIGYKDGVNASLRFPKMKGVHVPKVMDIADKHRSKFVYTVVRMEGQREVKDVIDDLEKQEEVMNPHIVINSNYKSEGDVYDFIDNVKELVKDYAKMYEKEVKQ